MEQNEYLEKATGQRFEISLTSTQEEEGGYWYTKGHVLFGASIDQENWTVREQDVKIHEKTVDESIASVMLHFSNILNDVNVLEEMNRELEAFANGEEE